MSDLSDPQASLWWLDRPLLDFSFVFLTDKTCLGVLNYAIRKAVMVNYFQV
jgi:hypothetical protein